VEFAGDKMAFNVPVLGRGKVGIVLTAHTKTMRVALKIRRVDADRKEMMHEAKMLKKANETQVGPQLIDVRKDFLLMEFLEGITLPHWVTSLKGRGSRKRIRMVLLDALEQCKRLDEIGLDHGELSRAPKHIIVDSQDRTHIIDFEAASTERRPSNVTSLCQYLFIGSQLARMLNRRLGQIDNKALISALRRYKFARAQQNFATILKVCNLKKLPRTGRAWTPPKKAPHCKQKKTMGVAHLISKPNSLQPNARANHEGCSACLLHQTRDSRAQSSTPSQ
jgi:putative serine/threonine protein kinase